MFSGLTTSEVADLTGLSLRQIRYLAQHDVVTPSLKPAEGRGSVVLYAPTDVHELAVVAALRAAGGEQTVDRVREAVTALRRRDDPQRGLLALTADGALVIDASLVDALHGADAALVVDLTAVSRRILRRAVRIGLPQRAAA